MRFTTRSSAITDDLVEVAWFSDLTPEQRRAARRHADRVRVEPGTRLQRQGFHARWLWVPVDGHLELQRNGTVVGTVPPGGAWGEAEALLGLPSSVDVVAPAATTVVSLGAAAFHGMLGDAAFAATVARRQARASLRPQPATASTTATDSVSPAA